MLLTTRFTDESGERAAVSGVYTLPDGSRVRIRAGGVIPPGAVPDVSRDVETRVKSTAARSTKARKEAPENRSQ